MASWSGWREIPGGQKTPSGPRAYGAVVTAVRGEDNTVYLNHFLSGTSWSGWAPIPGLATDAAPCIGDFGGGPVVVAKRLDRKIFYNRLSGTSPTVWQEVPGGGLTTAGPAVAGRVIVVRGTDDGIHFNGLKQDGSWNGWREVAGHGKTPSAPAISNFGQHFLTLVRGTDNFIYFQKIESDLRTYDAWKRVPGGGKTLSGPAVSGSMAVVRGTNDLLYYNGYDGQSHWDGWREMPGGGATQDSPGLAYSSGYLTLVTRGSNNGIHYNFWS